jgi:uncharacterized protein YjbI with pentapeptide repeats/membrane protein implicated in regulation of membrane protease activity
LSGRHAPSLWPIWITGSLAVVVALAMAVAIYLGLQKLAAASATPRTPIYSLDVIRTTITIAGFIGVVLAGVYAYRKQRLAEGDARRADAEQLAQRYTTAAEQLGHGSSAVRLAGVYAMARLADDWPDQRKVCIDVLCAYLRMPYQPSTDSEEHREGEFEIRQTIIRVIRDHLQAPDSPTTWCGYDLDFTGATFDGGDLSGSQFTRGAEVSFVGAKFGDGRTSFEGAQFNGASVSFRGAQFNGGRVSFDSATFHDGEVNFVGAEFTDGEVSFYGATFSGAEVPFFGAQWEGDAESFNRATSFGADIPSLASKFSGGRVSFIEATFSSGHVSFGTPINASGQFIFVGANISAGVVSFNRANFIGTAVSFIGVTFSGGDVSFREATFTSGRVSFDRANFDGGEISFERAKCGEGQVSFVDTRIDGSNVIWGPFEPF